MKNYKMNWKAFTVLLLACLTMVVESCKKSENGTEAPPVIARIRTIAVSDTNQVSQRVTLDSNTTVTVIDKLPSDQTVTGGRWSMQFAIIGSNLGTTKSVTLNGMPLYFNPALVTDNSIIFVLAPNTPYGTDQTNKISVTTKYGTTEFDFTVIQPPAVITAISSLTGAPGKLITITGTIFDNVSAVKFGAIPAEIVGTPTKTSITVKIPEGITAAQSPVSVTTPGGTTVATSSFFVFKKLLYDDVLTTGMVSYGGWGGTGDIANKTVERRGDASIKLNFTGYDCPLQYAYTGATPIDLTTFTSFKLSIYGGPGSSGKKVKIQFNGEGAAGATIFLTEGAFADFVIPISSITTSKTFTKLWIVEASGSKAPIYVDEIGFL